MCIFQWGTALHHAAAEGRTETMELLLKHGADPHASNEVRLEYNSYTDSEMHAVVVGNNDDKQ